MAASVSPGRGSKSHVRVGVSLHLQAGTRERDATEWRQRQAEREQLGTGVANDPPTEATFSIEPVMGITSSPSSVTAADDRRIGGGNMWAPTLSARSPRCFDQMRPPTRSLASSSTGS